MPCPLFSRQDSVCHLAEPALEGDEEERAPAVSELPTDLGLCLAPDQRYRQCPVYRGLFAPTPTFPNPSSRS